MVSWSKSNLIFPKNKSLSMAIVVFSLLCFNISASELVVHERGLSAAQRLGVLKMLKSKDDYFLLTNNGLCKVQKHDVSPCLRRMTNDQLIKFLNEDNGNIRVGQFSNGEFKLDRHVYGKGGGALGAAVGVVAGTAVVQGVAHGTIWTIAACTGPFVFYVGYALEAACAPAIASATVYGAAVGGMTGMVITGPA